MPQFNVFHFNGHLNVLVVVVVHIVGNIYRPEIMLVTVTNCVVAKCIILRFSISIIVTRDFVDKITVTFSCVILFFVTFV